MDFEAVADLWGSKVVVEAMVVVEAVAVDTRKSTHSVDRYREMYHFYHLIEYTKRAKQKPEKTFLHYRVCVSSGYCSTQ